MKVYIKYFISTLKTVGCIRVCDIDYLINIINEYIIYELYPKTLFYID